MRESKPLSKVPIGNHYHPEHRPKPTWEELEIQYWLLRKPGKRRLSDGFMAVVCIVAAFVLLGVIV